MSDERSTARGSAFLLKLGDGGSPVAYATVAGLRTTALTINQVPETNNNTARTAAFVSVSGAGVFTGSAAEVRIKANALSGVLDDYRLSFEDGSTMTGKFLITRLDYAGDFNGERSYMLSLESSGPVLT